MKSAQIMKQMKWTYASPIVILSVGIISSCSKHSGYSGTTSSGPSVQLTSVANFGNILTDGNGRSLYFFFDDADSNSTCDGGCSAIWPTFYAENPNFGSGLNSSDFAVITRADGTKQTTYKGWPLYYYAGDSKVGDVTGDKVNNLWAVAKADYSVMVAVGQLVGLDGVNYNDQSLAGTGVSQYLTDPYGRTLYLFTKDSANTNKFTKPDFSNNPIWPIDQTNSVGSIPSILDSSEFGVISVYGKNQLTFERRPLYYFGQDDSLRGATKGVSYPTPGAAIWKVLNNNTPAL
jgi:predicted lipoprotein with Yx(FWY)xxD motif